MRRSSFICDLTIDKNLTKFSQHSTMEVNMLMLNSIPGTMKSDWFLEVDGVRTPFSHVKLEVNNPDKGIHRVVQCGHVDDGKGGGYVGVVYWERGGGGVVSIPYSWINGVLHIGVAVQVRQFMGGEVRNAVGGYKSLDATVESDAAMEVAEEVGAPTEPIFYPTIQLPGEPTNFNRGLADTTEEGEGIHFTAFKVAPEALEKNEEATAYIFKPGLVRRAKEKKDGTEFIGIVEFYPWTQVALFKDQLVHAGVLRLLVRLTEDSNVCISEK